jgi:hypothetical protein
VKTYRSPRDVLAEIDHLLAENKPSTSSPSVLVQTAKLLHDARNYYRVGIYLVINDRVVRQAICGPELPKPGTPPSSRAEIATPLKVGTQTLGYLRAEGEPSAAAGLPSEDRVLLKETAFALARFLRGRGRYLMRKAREAVREAAEAKVEDRSRPTAVAEKNEAPKRESLRAAAGEKVSA